MEIIVWVNFSKNKMVSQQVTDVWKALKTAEILMDPYLYRVECCTAFSGEAQAN